MAELIASVSSNAHEDNRRVVRALIFNRLTYGTGGREPVLRSWH
ncbi:hypothetical protein [Corynebacterium glyciniphilum]|nr:hypothetical protein [Corynebacterium glyciniphilum]